MAQVNTNIVTSWNGITGEEVQNRIKALFQANVAAINQSITAIEFSQDQEKSDRVNYTLTNGAGLITTGHFDLTPIANITAILDSISAPDYVEPGSNARINYSFHVENADNEYVSGRSVTLTIEIRNGNYTKVITAAGSGQSYSARPRTGTYTINASDLKEGKNRITVTLGGTYLGAAFSFRTADGIDNYVDTYSFNLNLISNLDGISCSQLASISTPFEIKNTYNDGSGRDITTYGIDASNVSTSIYNSVGNLVLSFTGKNSDSTTLQSITNSGLPERAFYIQSKIVFDSETVYSNVVKYQLIVNDETLTGDSTRVAYCLPTYVNDGASINFAVNTIKANQYTTAEFEIYAYIPVDKTFLYVMNSSVISKINKTGDTTQLQDMSWSYQLVLRTENTFSLLDNVSNLLTVTINTVNLANDLQVPSGQIVSLSSNGKTGSDKEWTYGNYSTIFNNFDWTSNGWIDGALVVNNNARAIINIAPCQKIIGDGNNNTITGRAISFRFKTSNENTNECLIDCYDNAHDGFQIYPQKAIIRKGNQSMETLFTTEDSEKEITFVWYNTNYGSLSIIYVNGTSQAVLSSGTSTSNNSFITITSNETTLYLYNVEVYNKAISFNEVQALCTYHKATNVSDYILSNAIFNSDVTIGNNGQKVTIDNLPVGSTYVLIKAHPNGPNKPWEIINNLPAQMTVGNKSKETKSWRLLAGNTYLITKVADGADSFNFFADKIALSGQGTSSMSYPVKNFRIYFNKKATPQEDAGGLEGFASANSYGKNDTITTVFKSGSEVTGPDYTTNSGDSVAEYRIFSNSLPANVFCLKADYAESSGVHNTGFARMANVALETSGSIQSGESDKLPHNSVAESNENEPIRSTIDGKPVYLFFADHEGNITYHGKYNFNNEKASENIFGFEDNGTSESTSYFDNTTVQTEAELIRTKTGLSAQDYEAIHGKFHDHTGTEFVNPTECWEFSTNDASEIAHRELLGEYLSQIGAFTFPYTSENGNAVSGYPFSGNAVYNGLNPFEELTNQGELAWLNTEQAWEYRYPDLDSDSEGDILYTSGEVKPYLLQTLYKWVHKHNVYLWDTQYKDNHAATFASELHNYFNVNYLVKYYVLTKMFINADQRIKNCMLAFYCDPNVTPTAEMGHMRAFYIFYDNDTILGVSNTGNLTNPWNCGEDYGVYQGIDRNGVSFHGIWGNLEYCYQKYINNGTSNQFILALGKLVEDAYRSLRNALPDTTIKQFLNSSLPDSADNVDAEVKYFYPSTISPNASDFNSGNISQYQGNRKYHREWLLDKRMKWFDAKYGAGTIANYQIDFRMLAGSGTMSSGEIGLYPEFDEWRFYLKQGDAATLIPTSLLSKNLRGILTYINTVNSNVVRLQGLYGANKIDFSKWYGNTIENHVAVINSDSYLSLPYVKEFILGSDNAPLYIASDQLGQFFKAGNVVLMPNLETLVIKNLKGVSQNNLSAFDLDLSDLTKLVSIDATDTDTAINLPEGSQLEVLKLYRPLDLEFVNKVNLETLVLDASSQIENVVVNHCSDYLYNWALTLFLANYQTITSMEIVIGTDEDKDTLSDDTISKLVLVAELIQDRGLTNISITGIGYNAHITQSQNSTLFNVFGSDLVISSVDSSEFTLNLEQGVYLYEGSTLYVSPSLKVDDNGWRIQFVDDPDNIKNYITVDPSSSPYLCVLSAARINNNTSHTVTLKVIATHNGTEYESDIITVRYVGITGVILSAFDNIVSNETTISISLDANTTKQHLLDTTYSANISSSTDNGNISLIQSGTAITGIDYIPESGKDANITFTIFGISGSILMYYNIEVCTVNDLTSNTSLAWLNDLIDAYKQQVLVTNTQKVMRSDLNKYIITTSGGTITSNIGNGTSVKPSEAEGYDLTALSYFKSGSSFTIPVAFKFVNLTIPEGVTTVDWNSTYSGYRGYGTIKFPSTTRKVRVNIDLDAVFGSMKFDLTNANEIKKIYNESTVNTASALPENGIFSLCLTSKSLTGTSSILFDYPTTGITQIGNYSETIGTSISVPSAMFNIISNEQPIDFSGTAEAIYKLGSPINSSGIKIGLISSYRMSTTDVINWNAVSPYVKGLYYTFYKGSGCPSSLTFNALEKIGDCSFYIDQSGEMSNETLNIGSSVTSIGFNAFSSFTHDIQGSFANVTRVSQGAFWGMAVNHTFTFSNLDYVGARAFTSNSSFTINLNNVGDSITYIAPVLEYPFGNNKTNTLVVQNQTLKDTLIATYGNDVNIL